MSFGRLRDKGSRPQAEINMIPLIDVMLVLLVIFILTAPLVTQSVKLQLPEAVDLKEKNPEQAPTKPVMIAVNSDLVIHLNDEAIEEGGLLSHLEQLKASLPDNDNNPMIQLHIDASVPYEQVAKIIADLSKVGLSNLGFVSLPEEPSSP